MEALLRTKTGNPTYLGGKKQNISFSQNLPNMGGESCTVLRLRLMHKLAMSLNGGGYAV